MLLGGLVVALATACQPPLNSVITVIRIPNEGRMPHVAVDASGATHLMYFRGSMSGGDLLYVTLEPGGTSWSSPIRVNSEPRSAIGMGPMDGGDMALSQHNGLRLHGVWYLTDPLRILYARSTPGHISFEPQRVIWELVDEVIEARPSVTVDVQEHVFIAWHGATVDGTDDANRAIFMMTSNDGGDTFDPPRVISPASEGACGCCSLETFSATGRIWVSYRSAGDNVHRDQHLLRSTDGGISFVDEVIQPWLIGACPVTTTTFALGPDSVRVAWETNGQVHFAPIDDLTNMVSPDRVGRFRHKNPAIATNRRGRTLLAWGDAPGYRAGGTLQWQVFNPDGRALSQMSPGTDTIPSGSGPAVVVRSDDSFLVIY